MINNQEQPKCDRDALIELANEIEAEGQRYVSMFDETSSTAATLFGYAYRIFEALGMEDNDNR